MNEGQTYGETIEAFALAMIGTGRVEFHSEHERRELISAAENFIAIIRERAIAERKAMQGGELGSIEDRGPGE